ncbi:MAG: GAF domain-containing protein [Bacteroidales bacterium]
MEKENNKKARRYERIITQLNEQIPKTNNPLSRMSTIIAVLHNKMDDFFWTGYYHLIEGQLLVGAYQGSLACQILKKDVGVCWAAINRGEIVIVKDVNQFEGHIACDGRSNSEIVIPIRNKEGEIIACLDVDSKELNTFDETDAKYLEQITNMIYS